MYENLITPQSRSNSQNTLSVRLAAIPIHEKVAYIDSVCAALNDTRFGRRMTPFIINLSELPEDEEAVFCEMTADGPVPSYVVRPDSELARRYAADILRQGIALARFSAA